MPRSRVSGSAHQTGRARQSSSGVLESKTFVGVSLGGAKSDKTCAAILEYYPKQERIFLKYLFDHVKAEEGVSSDQALLEILKGARATLIAFDAPLSLPSCIDCKEKCPGFENCKEPHITWFWEHYKKEHKKNKNHKLFSPYTQRPVEAYISTELEEAFHPSDALGANTAPLTARLHYLQKHLKNEKLIEVYPRLSIWRFGKQLRISKKYLMFHKHAVEGDRARQMILERMMEEEMVFLYQQDVTRLVHNANLFDAFISAFTAYWKFLKKTEPRPEDFPKKEAWIEFPL